MTDRQARKLIYAVIETNKDRFNDDTLEALEMGRVALEQPTVCDIEQIRAEIQAYADKLELCNASPSLEYILQIIDKYKEQTE